MKNVTSNVCLAGRDTGNDFFVLQISGSSVMFPGTHISFPIVPNQLFLGRTKNNRHFGYLETKITDFKILGTRLGTTLRHCRLILETETEPGTKSCFHYLCLQVMDRYWKEVIQVSTLKNDIKVQYLYDMTNFIS